MDKVNQTTFANDNNKIFDEASQAFENESAKSQLWIFTVAICWASASLILRKVELPLAAAWPAVFVVIMLAIMRHQRRLTKEFIDQVKVIRKS
jgi:hypothetical protein